ncbi:hypothetical protein E4U55_005821 [Claviceps digitariae]|nr:hypothetical protein E4U55_005821 [Claviceps digitariae]
MASRRMLSRCVYGVLMTRAAAQLSQAQLCASVNTASNDPTPNTYQSVGACSSTCGTQYAYAVLQNNLCWCSNYGPDESTQRNNACHLACPGYPADTCGGAGGLYSYVLVNAALVRGTKGGGDDSDSGDEKPHRSSSPPSSPPPSPHNQPATPPPHVQTKTLDGIVQTVTVTPTDYASTSDPSNTQPPASSSQPAVSTGALVGIALGCVLAVILAIGGTACLILSKKRTRNGHLLDDTASASATAATARARGASSSTILSETSTAALTKNPFADGPLALYGQRDRAGSIETIRPPKENCLRIVNPDPPEK